MAGHLVVRRALPRDAPAIDALLEDADLDRDLRLDQFLVAEALGQVIACARLKPLTTGGVELASVAVERRLRAHGIGRRLVSYALALTDGPVYALAMAPGFFQRLGFKPVARDALPPEVETRAQTTCATQDFVAMRRDHDEGGGENTV